MVCKAKYKRFLIRKCPVVKPIAEGEAQVKLHLPTVKENAQGRYTLRLKLLSRYINIKFSALA